MSQIPLISPDELSAKLAAGEPLRIVDVRSAADFAEWRIPGSVHVAAGGDLKMGGQAALEAAAAGWDRGVPVVTVCNQGNTSKLAAEALASMGFQTLSMIGGMRAWSEAWNVAEVKLPPGKARVIQVRRTGKGCLSYLVISEGQAAVVDPSVPCEVYESLAKANGTRITSVLETHVHADHVSRGYELARRTGAPIYLPAQNRVKLAFEPLLDGAEVRVGDSVIRCIATPGHTPESVCYLVDGAALLSGDTLFVEGVGRPDLKAEGDESRQRARLLFHSLTERLFTMPPDVIILPCHSPEPLEFDGKPHAATLAAARAASGMSGKTEDSFVSDVLSRIPPTPPNHLHIVRINEGLDPAPDGLASLEAGANRCAIPAR